MSYTDRELEAENDRYRDAHRKEVTSVYEQADQALTRTVAADNFCGTLSVNVDNDNLSDSEFRQFVRNSLPIVIFREE